MPLGICPVRPTIARPTENKPGCSAGRINGHIMPENNLSVHNAAMLTDKLRPAGILITCHNVQSKPAAFHKNKLSVSLVIIPHTIRMTFRSLHIKKMSLADTCRLSNIRHP